MLFADRQEARQIKHASFPRSREDLGAFGEEKLKPLGVAMTNWRHGVSPTF
jgi:hypothetical protein